VKSANLAANPRHAFHVNAACNARRHSCAGLHLQALFDRALQRMAAEGWSDDEVDQLRSVSLHWLRHTSATFDAPLRDMKDLQADLRHNSLSTTQNTYYNSLDEQRAHSVKGLKIKR
jgi:integrase